MNQLKKILKDSVEACEKVGLKPFLIFGTLLGFVRENDFIAHDHDIDLGLSQSDFQKKHLIKEILVQKGYKLQCDDEYLISLVHPEAASFYVDFHQVYKNDDHWMIGWWSPDQEKKLLSRQFPLEAMNEFRTVHFHHQAILIPSHPDLFLSAAYGQWQVPQIEHRTNQNTKGRLHEVS